MCSHYEAPSRERLLAGFGTEPSDPFTCDLWPTYVGPFIRLNTQEAVDDGMPEFDAQVGSFGLLPFWSKDRSLARRTYNARHETVSTKTSFRDAWRKGRFCIIPAAAIYEPDWRTGKAVSTRITRADDGVMSIAGLWDEWVSPAGERQLSYSMLTVNADHHPFMRNYHRPQDEKRSVVVLPNGAIRAWLNATVDQASDFMQLYPADKLSCSVYIDQG